MLSACQTQKTGEKRLCKQICVLFFRVPQTLASGPNIGSFQWAREARVNGAFSRISFLTHQGSLWLIISVPAFTMLLACPFENKFLLTSANEIDYEECGQPPVI